MDAGSLEHDAPPVAKPRILLLPDKRHWAFDLVARQMARILSDKYDFSIRYIHDRPRLDIKDADLFYVFWWGEQHQRQFDLPPERLIKEVSSYRWMYDPPEGPIAAPEMVHRYLREAAMVTCTSQRMHDLLRPLHPCVRHTPNGFDPAVFHPLGRRGGPLRIGWAGSAADTVKGITDILRPACAGRFELHEAPGNLSFAQMNEFYNSVDVLAIASRHEGQPLPLMEAMAAGCFVVTVDVGIVPEVVRHGVNGLIVSERSVAAFQDAFDWCARNLDAVRLLGGRNAQEMPARRRWETLASGFSAVFDELLVRSARPLFRNDDVSADTDLPRFGEFCRVFWRHGYTQTHGLTLRGRTTVVYQTHGAETEYEGVPSIAKIPNEQIRELSVPWRMEDRPDLIAFLNESPDEIALHGLYHTDYSQMSALEQRADIREGLTLLRQMFPGKMVRHFIPPFNRTNAETYKVCAHFGLHVLEAKGIHLESELENVVIAPGKAYRYHHHRFYPESKFSYYPLNLARLEAALQRGRGASEISRARPAEQAAASDTAHATITS